MKRTRFVINKLQIGKHVLFVIIVCKVEYVIITEIQGNQGIYLTVEQQGRFHTGLHWKCWYSYLQDLLRIELDVNTISNWLHHF
jgi:hypothetical protein